MVRLELRVLGLDLRLDAVFRVVGEPGLDVLVEGVERLGVAALVLQLLGLRVEDPESCLHLFVPGVLQLLLDGGPVLVDIEGPLVLLDVGGEAHRLTELHGVVVFSENGHAVQGRRGAVRSDGAPGFGKRVDPLRSETSCARLKKNAAKRNPR